MTSAATADVVDQYRASGRIHVCELTFRSFGSRRGFSGPITTVRCHEDNGLVKKLIGQPGNGGVLVVDGGSSLRRALCGDRVAATAVRTGWAGIVIAGAVRDVVALGEIDIGIFALGSNPWPPTNNGTGEVSIDVRLGNAVFSTGGWVYADPDGLVVADGELSLA